MTTYKIPSKYLILPYLIRHEKSHVLIYPIYGDGWGVILEALSLAMPIICYDSFDKDEAVRDEYNGYLIPLPGHLSFLDGFWDGSYRNWNEYSSYIADHDNFPQVEFLAGALEQYCQHPELLLEHSRNAGALLEVNRNPAYRVTRIKEIYKEILQKLGQNDSKRKT